MSVIWWLLKPVFWLWDTWTFWRYGLEPDPKNPDKLIKRTRSRR